MSTDTPQVPSHDSHPAQPSEPPRQASRSIPRPELDFFNNLTAKLTIELTAPAELVAGQYNLRALPDAQVSNLSLRAEVHCETAGFRDLTPEELERVAFRDSRISLRAQSGDVIDHDAANGTFFTVRELLHAIEETERQTRGRTRWLGGIDVHHRYFEGIHLAADGVWDIVWGS
jgi:hypothetical protein